MLKGRTSRGFTLIELMIVIAIISILAGIMVPNFTRARAESHLSACQSNLKNISTAVEMYLVRNKTLPTSGWEFLTDDGKYLKTMPKCPAAGNVTYQLSVSPTDKSTYTIYCAGLNHKSCQVAQDRPAYVAGKGLIY